MLMDAIAFTGDIIVYIFSAIVGLLLIYMGSTFDNAAVATIIGGLIVIFDTIFVVIRFAC